MPLTRHTSSPSSPHSGPAEYSPVPHPTAYCLGGRVPGAQVTDQRADARRYGGFDVIRIAAALSVVLYHSYAITGRDQDLPALWIGHYRMPLGSIGVAVFFVISGFLVATSRDRA